MLYQRHADVASTIQSLHENTSNQVLTFCALSKAITITIAHLNTIKEHLLECQKFQNGLY